ncbi:MAG: YwiC-like family protein [Vicinamibacterales bacterium]|nr:YwiC-like family protein [Vicinamibacterales bacterium]
MTRHDRALLLPQEHGTYGEILFPLIAALAIGSPGAGAWGIAVASLGGFLAHEGFVVLLGRRGGRARREQARAAWRSLLGFGGIGLAGVWLAASGLGAEAWPWLALAAALSGLAILVAWSGRERTLGGEMLAAIALSAWCVPTALAAGCPLRLALTLWAAWSLVFMVATCAVHVVIARSTRRPHLEPLAAGWLLAVGAPVAAALLEWSGAVPSGTTVVLLPSCVAAAVVLTAPVTAHRLRDIGWSFIAVSTVTLALMLGLLR